MSIVFTLECILLLRPVASQTNVKVRYFKLAERTERLNRLVRHLELDKICIMAIINDWVLCCSLSMLGAKSDMIELLEIIGGSMVT